MGTYHKPESCNHCSGVNEITITNTMEPDLMCECSTVCKTCKKTDYWAYGYFESSNDIEGKCDTYET